MSGLSSIKLCLPLALCAGLALGAQAQDGGWSLQAPAQPPASPLDTLVVGVPAGLSATQLASLAVELDHIDVTALARFGAGQLSFTPPQALDGGPHELRIVEYAADGSLLPHGSWNFRVSTARAAARPAGAARKDYVKGSVGATLSERVAQSDLTPPLPAAFTANGSFDLKAARSLAEWTVEASLDGIAGTDNGTSQIAGHGLQPAQMQMAVSHGKDKLVLGDQTLPYDNLAMSGMSRRGLSIHLGELPAGFEATAFAVRDSSVAGFYGGLGVDASGDNVSGAMVQAHPLAGQPQALTLLAGYVSGTAPAGLSTVAPYPGGNGSYPPNTPVGTVLPVQSGSGNAWVAGASSELPGTGLRLNGQAAGSSFEFPGTSGQDSVRASDKAYSASVAERYALAPAWSLNGALSYQKVGTYFTSLANPTLVPDRRSATASLSLAGKGLSLGASGGFNEDNTDANPATATVRSLPRSLNLSYGPSLPGSITDWLGTPSLSLAHQDARSRNRTAPSGSTPTDNTVVNNTGSLNFGYPRFSWQLGLTDGSLRDATGQQDNTDTFGPSLGLNVNLPGAASISLNLQVLDVHDLPQGTHTIDHNYALNASDTLFGGALSANLTLAINHNTQQVAPGSIPPQLLGNALVLKTATAQLTWHAIAATPARGGLDVGLATSWNDSSGLNSAALTTQGYAALASRGMQTFLTVSSRWPIDRGGP
jgi:hypothetical protein